MEPPVHALLNEGFGNFFVVRKNCFFIELVYFDSCISDLDCFCPLRY